jgi:hypothetical protein
MTHTFLNKNDFLRKRVTHPQKALTASQHNDNLTAPPRDPTLTPHIAQAVKRGDKNTNLPAATATGTGGDMFCVSSSSSIIKGMSSKRLITMVVESRPSEKRKNVAP